MKEIMTANGMVHQYEEQIPTDKTVELRNTNPHYSDPKYKHPQTIFGSKEGVTQYNYSDRLQGMDRHTDAVAVARAHFSSGSAAYYETYLNYLFAERYEILHIMAGVNLSNGFSYLIFGYRRRT